MGITVGRCGNGLTCDEATFKCIRSKSIKIILYDHARVRTGVRARLRVRARVRISDNIVYWMS